MRSQLANRRIRLRYYWLSLAAMLLSFVVPAQSNLTASSVRVGESYLAYPWAGGMNSMQFGALDLNRDGIMDLVALDRDGVNNSSINFPGNRKLCFINQGIPDSISYYYAPQYNRQLPELYNWAIFTDYDGDGKNDIFTYSPGWSSIMVYHNVSSDALKFERVVYPYLTSFQNGGYVNILTTYTDYPGIADIDYDGDLDILSFSALGTFVQMHKNMSMEKYGHADSLDFTKTTECWGQFGESDESNQIYLDSCPDQQEANPLNNSRTILKDRHTGSTFLLLDLDGDQDRDLLLGDVDYPGLYVLTNGGNKEEALVTAYDSLFPTADENIKLFSMPAAACLDVNNDGLNDLLVSPFDPDIEKSQNKNSVWLYLNTGQNEAPVFSLKTHSFLQDQMIDQGSGAYPLLYDWDQDGLTDLLLGNFGFYLRSWFEGSQLHTAYRSRIDLYKNTGSPQNPAFQLWIKNVGNLWAEGLTGLFPAMGDLDGDGQAELLTGQHEGQLILLKMNGEGQFEITDPYYLDIDVGSYSTPQLFDLDKDGLLDLIIGEQGGNLNYYHNAGTATTPDFSFITDSLGKVNVTDEQLSLYGFSTPHFFRNPSGSTGLIVGSEEGMLHYFTDIDGNLSGRFTTSDGLAALLDTTGISFDLGLRTAACMSDLNGDGKWEMIAGNYSGGLEFFHASPTVSPGIKTPFHTNNTLLIYPNPAHHMVDIQLPGDGDLSIQVFNSSGQLVYQGIHHFEMNHSLLDVSGFNKGIYFLSLNYRNRLHTGKLMIQ